MKEGIQSSKRTSWVNQEWAKWVVPALVGLLGVALGTFLTQLFLRRTVAIQQGAELQREIAKAGSPYLMKVKRFAMLGKEVAVTVFLSKEAGPDGAMLGVAKDGPKYFLPQMLCDSERLEEWHRLFDEIVKSRDYIEPGVYEAFQKVADFVHQNPVPSKPLSSVREVEKSAFRDGNSVETFRALNDYLLLKVNILMGFE